jgi:L-ascorbate metabolism protein UlaG (beta-lactamase superfamily)
MEVTWYGHSCFRITERNMASVVTDPYDHAAVGYSALKLRSDIVTVSHDAPGHNFVKAVKGAKWHITGAGEYEIGGVFLTAVPTGKGNNNKNGDKNMAFVFDYDGVNIVHLGGIKSVPSRKEVEAFGNVGVLLIPVGGGSGLSAAKAAEVVNLIEPGVVVPMHYSTPDSSVDLNSLNAFLKQMGLGSQYEEQESLKVRKRDIPTETRVTVLSYKKAA